MTQPNPNDQAAAEKVAAEKSRRPKRGDLVSFTRRDVISGDQLSGTGVVLGAGGGGAVTVRPLAEYSIEVDPADVDAVVVDEV